MPPKTTAPIGRYRRPTAITPPRQPYEPDPRSGFVLVTVLPSGTGIYEFIGR
jgi:hypothetical protein